MTDLAAALAPIPRPSLATLPTPLQDGTLLPSGARLLVKRDDLSGLGMGGNKARKLELLCGAALADGSDVLVTVGAEQSNHARMTAAAGAILGIETHLVLGGDPGAAATGNRLLGELFGAHVHQPGTDEWTELSQALEALVDELRAAGRRPYAIPIGGSTEIGALGFVAAWCELRRQLDERDLRPAAIVHASSTGGTPRGPACGSGGGRRGRPPRPADPGGRGGQGAGAPGCSTAPIPARRSRGCWAPMAMVGSGPETASCSGTRAASRRCLRMVAFRLELRMTTHRQTVKFGFGVKRSS
jgi:hypothetical protein